MATKPKKNMDFTKILDHLGHFGYFQAFLFTLACIVQLFVGVHMLANAFFLAVPKHRYTFDCNIRNQSFPHQT